MDSSITDKINGFIDNPSYVWVPIVAFAAIILIAGLIGFWNGWKTSLYFFGWNLVGVIAGVLSTSSITNALDGVSMLKPFIASIGNVFGLLILFVIMIVVNFLAFLFYWIFRKKLKKSIKANKKAGKSNFSSRWIGAGIAITSAFPSAIFLSNTSAVMSTENGFTKFTDTLAKAFTGGKYEGTADARVLVKNLDSITKLASAFGDSGNLGDLKSQETKDALQNVLNTDFSKNIDDIYNGIKGSSIGSGINDGDLASVAPADIVNNIPPMGLKINKDKQDDLHAALTNIFKGDNNPEASKIADNIIAQLMA